MPTKSKTCKKKLSISVESVLQRFAKFNNQRDAEEWLLNYIQNIAKVTNPDTICAVFDIDGTILRDRDDKPPLCNRMMSSLFQECRKYKIPLFIITARPEGRDQRKWTVDQLTKCGYPVGSYVELIMMPLKEWNMTSGNWNFSNYKFLARQRIVKQYERSIILCAGDQWSDTLRIAPCPTTEEERITYDAVKKLSPTGVYVGSLVDLSWVSIKLPG